MQTEADWELQTAEHVDYMPVSVDTSIAAARPSAGAEATCIAHKHSTVPAHAALEQQRMQATVLQCTAQCESAVEDLAAMARGCAREARALQERLQTLRAARRQRGLAP